MTADRPPVEDETVLDASAVLALLQEEPVSHVVARHLPRAVIGAVNLSEVAAKLSDQGLDAASVEDIVFSLGVRVVAFDAGQALAAGVLRPGARSAGLSLGDRACLALALGRGATALTANRAWARLPVGVKVELLR